MNNIFPKIRYWSDFLIALPKTLIFNFYYLPVKQAVKLPILLAKPKFKMLKGKVVIDCQTVKFGMIKMGGYNVSIYPNDGIIWENKGGIVVFKGKCTIGNGAGISVGETGYLELGKDFLATANLKLVCYYSIVFGVHTRIGWNNLIMDSSMHKLKQKDGTLLGKGYGSIIIGRNNWLSNGCSVYPNSKTPEYCIFGASSIINKDYSNKPSYILMAGNPLQIKRENIWRDVEDDQIEYVPSDNYLNFK